MKDSTSHKIICKSCNVHSVSRICDLMRHIKKCDSSITTPIEYKIKYEYNNVLPKCSNCNEAPVEVMKTDISKYCRTCRINKMKDMVKKHAIERFKDPAIKKRIMDKRKITNIKKYGVEHVSQLDEIKQKVKQTAFDKYGVAPLEIPAVKQARLYSLEHNKEEINRKRKIAWTDELIESAKQARVETCVNKYEVKHITELDFVREKISKKAIDRYKDPLFKEKMKQNILNLYGVEYISQLDQIKDKIIETSLKKYNARHYLASNLRKEKMIESKKWLPDHLIAPFMLYKRKCKKETNKHVRILYSRWDGRCYYTKEKLFTDKTQYNHPLYRTIDHKIPIYIGFIMDMSPLDIGNIENLCICSRGFNSSKNIKVI